MRQTLLKVVKSVIKEKYIDEYKNKKMFAKIRVAFGVSCLQFLNICKHMFASIDHVNFLIYFAKYFKMYFKRK